MQENSSSPRKRGSCSRKADAWDVEKWQAEKVVREKGRKNHDRFQKKDNPLKIAKLGQKINFTISDGDR